MAVLTREQAREVDRVAMEELAMPGLILMENAARGIADVLRARWPSPKGPVAIVCGPGNNGGDGFATARHLHNAGIDVRLHLLVPAEAFREDSDAGINLAVVQRMGLVLREDLDLADAGVVVDAIFGTGLAREVRNPYREAVVAINAACRDVLAVDVPSGLDANTGAVLGVAVKAILTATMVAPKVGFERGQGPAHVGTVEVVDIGVPPEVVARVVGR